MSESWPLKPIGEICEILDKLRKPITKRNRVSGEYPYYGATGIVDYVDGYIFDEKLILVGEDGAKWGSGENTAFAVEGKYWVNNHAHVIRPNRSIVLDNWLIYFLNMSDLNKHITGVTVPKLNQGKLREIQIPVPPLEEQIRILSILDDVFDKYKKIDIRILMREKSVSELFQSLLDSFTNSEHGTTKSLIDLTENHKKDIVDGPFGSNLKREHFVKEGVPVLKIQNIKPFEIRLHKMDYVSEQKAVDLERHSFQKGDIIMTKLGNPLGVSAIVDELDKGIIVADLVRIRANKINTKFLCYQLNSPRIKAHINSFQKGSTRPRVRITIVRDLPIIVPPISEQKRIVNILDEAFILINKFRSNNNEDLYLQLKQSILQEAFNGNL